MIRFCTHCKEKLFKPHDFAQGVFKCKNCDVTLMIIECKDPLPNIEVNVQNISPNKILEVQKTLKLAPLKKEKLKNLVSVDEAWDKAVDFFKTKLLL